MKIKTKYRVMWVDHENYAQPEVNQDGFNSMEDAELYADQQKEDFPKEEYFAESYEEKTFDYQNKFNNNSNALENCDGWEDIYPEF